MDPTEIAAAAMFFCYIYAGGAAPPSPSHTVPASCTYGEWRDPPLPVIMPGTYDSEDTRANQRRIGHGHRPQH